MTPPTLITNRDVFFSGRGARTSVSAGRSGSRAGVVEEAIVVSFRQHARYGRAGLSGISERLDHRKTRWEPVECIRGDPRARRAGAGPTADFVLNFLSMKELH